MRKIRKSSQTCLGFFTDTGEGTLSGSSITGTPSQEEDWTLDALGNWSNYVTKTSGTTDLSQTRTANDVNEISNITETTGPSWITPAYDAAGNMTTVPKPSDLTAGYTATYDAWNRLIKLKDGANTVTEYEYDGINRRIVKSVYSSGTLDHSKHFYYNTSWQVLEVRKEVSGTEDTDPLEQFVYHPYYIDVLLLRDYDADTDGTSARHYYIHDANFNVTAITNDTGTVLERYHYTPYGDLAILDADFSVDMDGISDISNTITYTGRRLDEESGIYYYRNRYYHAQFGLFIIRDPIKYEGSKWNLYEYVNGRSTKAVDPFGEGTVLATCGAGAVAGGVGGAAGGFITSFTFRGCACGGLGGAVQGCCSATWCTHSPTSCTLGSCICGGLGSFAQQLCNGSFDYKDKCSWLSLFTGVGVGCIGGLSGNAKEELVKFLTGLDVATLTNLCPIVNAPPQPGKVCCKLRSNFWTSRTFYKTISCNSNRSAFGCCRDYGEGGFFNKYEVLGATGGKCK